MLYKKGFVAGSFDLIHPGYIKLFNFAKKHCSFLIIGLHKDPSIERVKKHKPIHSLKERKLILSSVRFVDKIISYETENDLLNILKKNELNVRFLDKSYKELEYTGKNLKLPIIWVPRKHSYSTSNLIKKIKKSK